MSKPIILKIKQVKELFPKAPFNFDSTMHKPDHFPSADNKWEPGIRWQTMLWKKVLIGLKFENQATIDNSRVSLSIWSQGKLGQDFLNSITDEIKYRYNFQLDLTEFIQRFKNDSQLGSVINKWRGMKPLNVQLTL